MNKVFNEYYRQSALPIEPEWVWGEPDRELSSRRIVGTPTNNNDTGTRLIEAFIQASRSHSGAGSTRIQPQRQTLSQSKY